MRREGLGGDGLRGEMNWLPVWGTLGGALGC